MGDSISKMEGQLKAEQEKCIKLKIRLDDELKSEKLSREKLQKNVEALNKWKAECIVKVSSNK